MLTDVFCLASNVVIGGENCNDDDDDRDENDQCGSVDIALYS
jgi:hypothetical protein